MRESPSHAAAPLVAPVRRVLLIRAVGLAGLVWLAAMNSSLSAAPPSATTPQPSAQPAATLPAAATFVPTDGYRVHTVRGWQVLVEGSLETEHAELCDRTLDLLAHKLRDVERVVPPGPLERIRTIRFWVELAHPRHPCMCYHPDAGWLREHDMNPDKAGGVEIANAQRFLDWSATQPWMVLHELAHGYHHQFLPDGNENAQVCAAFEAAQRRGQYAEVLHASGRRKVAYASNNPMEYFAEASEAFFGTNDFYPFVRAELREHDPPLYAALEELWETR